MNANFSIKKISNIVLNARRYGKVYITTDGGAYLTESDAESAVRTKNMIIGEPTEFIGYVCITKDMLSNDRLKAIARNTDEFNKLFADAKIPRQRKAEQKQGRKYADPVKHNEVDVAEVEKLLGLVEEQKPANAEQKPAVETEKK